MMSTPPLETVVGNMTILHWPLADSSASAVPQAITRAQGKAILIQTGMWGGVLQFVATIPDATERALAEVALHDTQYWERDSPFLNAAATHLGLTQANMDDLFIAASAIRL
jgi:hypothetical protein